MTDMTGKFATVTDQQAAQHTELMALLNSIAEALGAPPVGPTTTLADVVTAITQTNTILAGIRSDMSDQQALLLTATQGIFNNTELMLENNSVNTQNLLSAILSNDPCKDCEATPSFPPPTDVTPQELDDVHCQRMQALLYALLRFSTKIDIVSSFGTGFSLTVIQDAFNEVLTELSNPSGLVIPSFVELTSLVAAVVSYIVSNVFSSNSIPFALQSINDALLAGLYATTNASDGLSEYASIINASSIDDSIKLVLIRIGYAGLFNFYFDPANTIDLTGYDGTICAPPDDDGCITVTVPGDEGTGDEGHGYGRITVSLLAFYSRITAETTIIPSVDVFVQANPFAGTNSLAGVEAVLYDFPYHDHIDKLTPGLEFTCQFCHLAPEEL